MRVYIGGFNMWFEKTKKVGGGKVTKKIKIMGITVFKKEKGNKIRCRILGIPLFSVINKKSPFYAAHIQEEEKRAEVVKALSAAEKTVLWIDHSLGGGTDVYSRGQFAAADKSAAFLRLQYFSAFQRFLLSLPKADAETKCSFVSMDEVYSFLRPIHFDEIVVNNLVGYPDTIKILEYVARLKESSGKKPKVSFRGHDYQCICPSFNLLDCNGNFCNVHYAGGCEDCLSKKMLGNSSIENKILRSGVQDMESWRTSWSAFFEKTVDEVVVFSEAVGQIFTSVYPQIDKKIKIIPHKTRSFPKAEVEPHKEVNIAMLGEISLHQKGGEVVRKMCGCLDRYPDVRLIVIGSYHNAPSNLRVTGKYAVEELPHIMKREKIDVVFIPSIWPETFSYTTSEAISMGLPVACYNLGAPAERVSVYDKGLVLKNIDADANLAQLVEFVKKIRKDS